MSMTISVMLFGYYLMALYILGIMLSCAYISYFLFLVYQGKKILPFEHRYVTMALWYLLFSVIVEGSLKIYVVIRLALEYLSLI